jgi:hypothetical protein
MEYIFSLWECVTCRDKKKMSIEDLEKHLLDVHEINTTYVERLKTKVRRIKAKYWNQFDFTYLYKNVVVRKSIRVKRHISWI